MYVDQLGCSQTFPLQTDINITSKWSWIEQLMPIMDSYRRWNTQVQAEDCDMAVNGHIHSPEVSIPVSSTPAAG